MYLKISNTDLGKAYMSFFLQIPISTKGRDKLVFSEIYYDQIFNMSINEDEQFNRLIFAYRISEKVNIIISEKINNYEVLQNNYINDILVSLSSLYFFNDKLFSVTTIENIIEELIKIDVKLFINFLEKYTLKMEEKFDDFIISQISNIQNILDVKKEAKKEYTNSDWLQNETSNWLKLEKTYKEIYEKIIKKLKQI
jgi:hypothetical protein